MSGRSSFQADAHIPLKALFPQLSKTRFFIYAIRAVLSDFPPKQMQIPSSEPSKIRVNYPHIAQTLRIPDLEHRLKAKSRARRLVDIRRALSAILVEQGYSVREIAEEFHRPHSTIVHFLATHRELRTTDTAYTALVQRLEEIA